MKRMRNPGKTDNSDDTEFRAASGTLVSEDLATKATHTFQVVLYFSRKLLKMLHSPVLQNCRDIRHYARPMLCHSSVQPQVCTLTLLKQINTEWRATIISLTQPGVLI